MDVDPIATEVRAARRRSRLNGATACALCCESDDVVLRSISRTLLEFHHVSGVANDPALGVGVCRNCHARLTEHQRREGVYLRHDPGRSFLERLADTLFAEAIFLEDSARSKRLLSDQCRVLDAQLKGEKSEPPADAP